MYDVKFNDLQTLADVSTEQVGLNESKKTSSEEDGTAAPVVPLEVKLQFEVFPQFVLDNPLTKYLSTLFFGLLVNVIDADDYVKGDEEFNVIFDTAWSPPHLLFQNQQKKGVWNTGLFGRQDKKIKWEGDLSTWNSGTLLNTQWEKGYFNTIYSLTQSWFADIDEKGYPYQKQNRPNNNGRSFNFAIDSEIKNSLIKNGTFINTEIGSTSTYSVMENHLLNSTIKSNIEITKAFLKIVTF